MRAVAFALAVRVWAPWLRRLEAAAAVQGAHVTSPERRAEPTAAAHFLCTAAGTTRIRLPVHTAMQRLRGRPAVALRSCLHRCHVLARETGKCRMPSSFFSFSQEYLFCIPGWLSRTGVVSCPSSRAEACVCCDLCPTTIPSIPPTPTHPARSALCTSAEKEQCVMWVTLGAHNKPLCREAKWLRRRPTTRTRLCVRSV